MRRSCVSVCAAARGGGVVGGRSRDPASSPRAKGRMRRACYRERVRKRERAGLRACACVDRARGHLRSSRHETASGLAPARGGVAVGRRILSAARMRNFDSPDVVFAPGVSSCPPGPAGAGAGAGRAGGGA